MMADALRGRRPNYLDRYARTLAAAYRTERIRKEIDAEQSRVQYFDSLIGQERQNLTVLTDALRVEASDTAELRRLLKEQEQLDTDIGIAQARGRAAAARAARLTGDDAEALSRAVTGQVAANRQAATVQTALELMRARPAASRAVLAEVERTRAASGVTDADLARLRAAVSEARPASVGVSPELREQFAEREGDIRETREALYFASPSGIKGGFAGLEVAQLRGLTAEALKERAEVEEDKASADRLKAKADALEASAYATAEDALQAALAVVRAGGDPSTIEDEYARSVYEEARQTQAYRNDQAADFDQGVLESRRRLAGLETEREKIAGAYDDPAKEAARRELVARGYQVFEGEEAWKNAYLRYQKTEDYPLYLGAYERYTEALAERRLLEPQTRGEEVASTFATMRLNRGRPVDIAQLRKQLQRAGIKGKEQEDAIAFTMAYIEAGGQDQTPEGIQAQAEQFKVAKQTQERQAERAEELTADIAGEQDDIAAQAELARRALRPDRDLASEYRRLRVSGMSQEDARAALSEQTERERVVRQTQPGEVLEVEGLSFTPEQVMREFTDPSDGAVYRERPGGGFDIFRDGKKTGTAQAGTRAATSIERVGKGEAPLPPPAPAPAPAPAPERPRVELEDIAITAERPEPAPAPAAESDDARLARLLREAGL